MFFLEITIGLIYRDRELKIVGNCRQKHDLEGDIFFSGVNMGKNREKVKIPKVCVCVLYIYIYIYIHIQYTHTHTYNKKSVCVYYIYIYIYIWNFYVKIDFEIQTCLFT